MKTVAIGALMEHARVRANEGMHAQAIAIAGAVRLSTTDEDVQRAVTGWSIAVNLAVYGVDSAAMEASAWSGLVEVL